MSEGIWLKVLFAMNTAPVVSIIIPTYNQAHLLVKCLQSVLSQTLTNWEALVINNFSDDNTIEVVNRFNDPRIQLVNFRNYGIIAASRNQGIDRSNADFIAFLDSDDIWYPSKLKVCIKELTGDRDLVCHNLKYVKNGKDITIDEKLEGRILRMEAQMMADLTKAFHFTGFRLHKQLRVLVKSVAFLDGKNKVTDEHLKKLRGLLKFMNYRYTEL